MSLIATDYRGNVPLFPAAGADWWSRGLCAGLRPVTQSQSASLTHTPTIIGLNEQQYRLPPSPRCSTHLSALLTIEHRPSSVRLWIMTHARIQSFPAACDDNNQARSRTTRDLW